MIMETFQISFLVTCIALIFTAKTGNSYFEQQVIYLFISLPTYLSNQQRIHLTRYHSISDRCILSGKSLQIVVLSGKN